ncbi:sigma-70 family RNA polymerase sigma factor [Paenibacillus rhizovicinus]|uniref:Sigma-70 family RNA polymerase sigma factor n=1 Tax=Paenibacillus rhizovicinus TaxID=2704463 RepID=A0A6C0NY32_9BACL|nr:sigma-70 family RNA polymerase sigma factor [Paenibacillus rhizovicinus]QHW31051.1 sigma-70 family RNA polymerase sigma factor [Paenibacillus rhizovicinus]
MDDIGWTELAKEGSREAFIALIRRNESLLYSIAHRMLTSQSDSLDAIQETILLAYKEIVNLREPAYFRTWLVRILINECRRVNRHHRKVIPVEQFRGKQEGSQTLESDLELMDLLNGLDMEHKEIVVLFYVEDLSIKEIAGIVELSENGVKSRLHRARQKLASLMTEPAWKEELR